jgi:hypothetical protein
LLRITPARGLGCFRGAFLFGVPFGFLFRTLWRFDVPHAGELG